MKFCNHCRKFENCVKGKNVYGRNSNHAEICKDFEEKKLTNFEKIKAMSIDEMALLIMCPAEYDLDFNKSCDCSGEMNRNCYECSKHWLESEVEE